jgi:hypothetical protein
MLSISSVVVATSAAPRIERIPMKVRRMAALAIAVVGPVAAPGLQARADDPPPEFDPGAGAPDDGQVPPEVTAELGAQTSLLAGDSMVMAPPSTDEMLQAQAPASDLATSGGPVLLRGSVVNPSGGGGGGELLVFLNDELSTSGDPTAMNPIFRVTLGPSGEFVVDPTITERIQGQMRDGAVNLLVAGTFQGRSFHTMLVRRYLPEAGAWQASDGKAPQPVSLVAGGATVPLTDSQRSLRSISGCSSSVIGSFTVSGIVGEVHDSSLFASFTYGTKADSELGVLFKERSGVWEVNGSAKVSRSQSVSNSVPLNANEHRFLYGNFVYHDVLHTCSDPYSYSEWRTSEPYAWGGGLARGRTITAKYCGGTDWNYRASVEAGGTFVRQSSKAQTWSGGVSVHGIGLSVRSGFSTSVKQTWKAGKVASWVCGNGAYPSLSTRVFTSNTKRG